ncbi:hypothetical protein [Rhodococcus globerulus]|uniref:Uncharacterized protein n=1 Tax=Rhodococcus globerulus TaxID=33008 RepID=A0ABU4BS29_RHOGO|nr:hypothetical protein [Rhodococcus globerulus]MDV6267032.1 hypothetical protein [Rhodococcus globerulus]
MSVVANQRDAAIEAIKRRDAAWGAFLLATVTGNREIGIAYDEYLEAERAIARTLPL